VPFNRDHIQIQINRLISNVETRLPASDPRLPANVINGLVVGMAGAINELHAHLDYNARQVVPDLADEENFALRAEWRGIPRLKVASAKGFVDFSGADGSTIPAGALLQRSDSVRYTVDVGGTISAGTVSLAITAIAAGQAGNAAAGMALSLVSPIPGVNASALVDSGELTGGADIETLDSWRDRLRDHVQRPPHGGRVNDYIRWAKEVPGVTRAWAFGGWMGSGSVGVYFVRDNDINMIPDAAEVQDVIDYIDPLRPAGMKQLGVFAPTPVAQNLTIALTPNTPAAQAAVQAELAELFDREAQVDDGNGSGTILLSHVREAISTAAGETDHNVVIPAADLTLTAGEISQLGIITWQ